LQLNFSRFETDFFAAIGCIRRVEAMVGTLQRGIVGSVVWGVSAVALLLGLTMLPNGAVRARDDCIEAPDSEPPQGAHWYYWTDRTTERTCWYLGEERQRARHVSARLPTESKTSRETQTTNSLVPPQWEPIARWHAASIGSADAPWPDPSQPMSAVPSDGALGNDPVFEDATMSTDRDEGASSPSWPTVAESNVSDSLPAPALRIFLLIAGALATSALIRALSRISAARRRRRWQRIRRERRDVFIPRSNGARYDRTYTQINPALARSSRSTHSPRSTDSYEDLEETLRELVRARERRLSLARQRLAV
jgi:hypothetical protein